MLAGLAYWGFAAPPLGREASAATRADGVRVGSCAEGSAELPIVVSPDVAGTGFGDASAEDVRHDYRCGEGHSPALVQCV